MFPLINYILSMNKFYFIHGYYLKSLKTVNMKKFSKNHSLLQLQTRKNDFFHREFNKQKTNY